MRFPGRLLMILVAGSLGASLTALAETPTGPPDEAATSFAGDDISIETFRSQLSQYGEWGRDEAGDYWRPTATAEDWRPYRDGRWLLLEDDLGWYWRSSEPWAWATNHYGRWARNGDRDWIWRPDLDWAPAWTAWAETDEAIGWAPMPPEGEPDAADWTFVAIGDFLGGDFTEVVLDAEGNAARLENARLGRTEMSDGAARNAFLAPERLGIDEGEPAMAEAGAESAEENAIHPLVAAVRLPKAKPDAAWIAANVRRIEPVRYHAPRRAPPAAQARRPTPPPGLYGPEIGYTMDGRPIRIHRPHGYWNGYQPAPPPPPGWGPRYRSMPPGW